MNAPFGRTGGKSFSYKKLIEIFPDKPKYVEVFGGSGVVLLNKPRVKCEVFNDIEKGLVEFYKCLQDPVRLKKISERLAATVHSRDFWNWCKDGEDHSKGDDLAFKWYYMTRNSFGQQGRAFGRSVGIYNADSRKLINSIEGFPEIHDRLFEVLIESQGFRQVMRDFDSEDTLFYLDPPYLDTFSNTYKHKFVKSDHKELLELIGKCKGTCVVSGYASELYDSQDYWTDRYSWEQDLLIRGTYREEGGYDKVEEVVWVKE